jgi:hypothetical protein
MLACAFLRRRVFQCACEDVGTLLLGFPHFHSGGGFQRPRVSAIVDFSRDPMLCSFVIMARAFFGTINRARSALNPFLTGTVTTSEPSNSRASRLVALHPGNHDYGYAVVSQLRRRSRSRRSQDRYTSSVISDNHFFGLIQALALPYGSSALASLMLHHIDQLSERISDIEPAYPPRLTVWPIFDRESRLPDSGQCLVQVVNFN